MRCQECGYEKRDAAEDCPKCSFRRAMQSAALVSPSSIDNPTAPAPQASLRRGPTTDRRRYAFLAFAAPALAMGWLYHTRVAPAAAVRAQVRNVYTAADGPCRAGDKADCLIAVHKLRYLQDYPDGSFLLADYRIAKYLSTQPQSASLEMRWQKNSLSEGELMAYGDAANQQNLVVSHSFWIMGNIKRKHITPPMMHIGGAKAAAPGGVF